jgi:hypothetical protein
VDLEHGGDNALWQWFCAAVLLSARIKSTAGKYSHRRNFIDMLTADRDQMSVGQLFFSGLAACQALFHHGVQSPSQMKVLGKEDCQKILRDSGYDRYGRAE